MGKVTAIIWIMAAPFFMGVFVMGVVLMPQLAQSEMEYITYAAILGAIVSIPASYGIAYKLMHLFDKVH